MKDRAIGFVNSVRPPDLTDLPNITIVLGEALKRAGVVSVGQLVALGAERAWERVHATGIQLSQAHVVLALEGAIVGLSWKDIPPARRRELMHRTLQLPAGEQLDPAGRAR